MRSPAWCATTPQRGPARQSEQMPVVGESGRSANGRSGLRCPNLFRAARKGKMDLALFPQVSIAF
ncbi:unnamed protein product [Gongylonema pulchrum]|uniref:LysR family transcriptional regulator n=1 Tax=Gongylonema pulchrum TaxID=637853 RepID=A0A183F1L9_9BILA|nr:unnamed protein product [Gongylonema pulchrum]